MPPLATGSPGRFAAGGPLYHRVRQGLAVVELACLGLLGWSIVATQVSGYEAPLWGGLTQVTAIAGAFYALLAMVMLLLLWGLVRAAWVAADRRRAVRQERTDPAG
jgi:uncharacterized membrane-anchored protein